MFTILKERRRRRSSFSQAMEEDSSWHLQNRMAAKSKNKNLTPEELIEQAKARFALMEEVEMDTPLDEDTGEPEPGNAYG